MKKIIYLLVLIVGLFSCIDTSSTKIDCLIGLSTDNVVVNNKAQTIVITTKHSVWDIDDVIDICGDKFSLDGSDFKGTYTYDNYFETIVNIDYEWFTIEKEHEKITIKLLENNTSESRTIRFYIEIYSKLQTLYKVDIVQESSSELESIEK